MLGCRKEERRRCVPRLQRRAPDKTPPERATRKGTQCPRKMGVRAGKMSLEPCFVHVQLQLGSRVTYQDELNGKCRPGGSPRYDNGLRSDKWEIPGKMSG